MSNSYQNKYDNRVSALDTALTFLLSLWKKIKYYVGILLIDTLLRNIVIWYDKHKSTATKNQKRQESEILHNLNSVLKSKEKECCELKTQLEIVKKDKQNLIKQTSQLNDFLNEEKELNTKFKQSLTDLEDSVNSLKKESEELRKRSLPKSQIPSMIFYAQGDSSGLWLRKISAVMSSDHLYTLKTKPYDTTVCTFMPIVQTDMTDIISNRNVTLLACEIISIAGNSTSIQIVEEGMAMLENNHWKVMQKAKIKII